MLRTSLRERSLATVEHRALAAARTDGSGGWQPLDRPLRTLTTLDRFGLVTWDGNQPMLRMLQVDELLLRWRDPPPEFRERWPPLSARLEETLRGALEETVAPNRSPQGSVG